MKKLFFAVFFLFFCATSYTQSNIDSVRNSIIIDSIYNIISQDISGKNKRKIIEDNLKDYADAPDGWDKIFLKFLEDSKKNSDHNNIFFCYCAIAEIKLYTDHLVSRSALDSAEYYLKRSKDYRQLAHYYYISGVYLYCYDPDNKHAVVDLYKALNYLEQYVKDPDLEIKTIYAIARETMLRSDVVSMKSLMDKIIKMQERLPDDPTLIFLNNEFNCIYHIVEYEKTFNENLIDSILFYELMTIKLYESGELHSRVVDANMTLIYLYVAEFEAKKKKPNFELINDCIVKAEELLKTSIDPLLISIRISYTQSNVCLVKNEIEQAEKYALNTLRLIDDYRDLGYSSLYIDCFNLLCSINEAKGNFKTSLEYNELKSKYELETYNNEVKTIELQFQADKKEAELIELEALNAFNIRSRQFAIIMCILLFLATLLLTLLFNAKRKSLAHQAHLEKLAADDAYLQLKLKNEQAKKTRLEKFEILTDFYLKEMELIGKTKELILLENEKKELDIQVDTFARKIEEYERSQYLLQTDKKGQQIYDVIRPEIERLIHKHAFTSKGYIRNLDNISDTFVNKLKANYDGNISVQYIKYCICFAIGMEINEVAECFSIEQTSVHGIRYKLKKKFDLDINGDLDFFLRQV